MLDRRPQRPGDGLTCAMPAVWNMAFATRSKMIMSAGLRISWSVSIISSSGFRRAAEKWRLGGRVSELAGAVAGR